MKKEYKKPVILFEDMEFNTAIAAPCDYVLSTGCTEQIGPDGETYWPMVDPNDTDLILFLEGIICNDIYECYHNPDGIGGDFSAALTDLS